MGSPLRSLVESGTRLWIDSIDPDLLARDRALGATGATSNPLIVADLVRSGRFDERLADLFERGHDDEEVAWRMTDQLVSDAERAFRDVFEASGGDDGYVSFELDPLLEDAQLGPPHAQRVRLYVELAKRWSEGHPNRMIKVPATAAGIEALEPIVAEGITVNVTLIFTPRQYGAARDAVWRGMQRGGRLERYKSVYSIFVSRVDVYTARDVPDLSPEAQGLVGILNAQRIWAENRDFWADKAVGLSQQIIFASTGTKLASDPPDRYVAALAGADIQTNPPDTNARVEQLGRTYTRTVDRLPPDPVVAEIDAKVDMERLERVLLEEGVKKFADPHKQLLETIAGKRRALAAAG